MNDLIVIFSYLSGMIGGIAASFLEIFGGHTAYQFAVILASYATTVLAYRRFK